MNNSVTINHTIIDSDKQNYIKIHGWDFETVTNPDGTQYDKPKWNELKLARAYIEQFNMFKHNNQCYMKYENIYVNIDSILKNIISKYSNLVASKVNKVFDTIKINIEPTKITNKNYKFILAATNGLINLNTMEQVWDGLVFNQLNVKYNPAIIENKHIDKFLNDISCNDKEVKKEIVQMILNTLIQGRYGKDVMWWLYGQKASGKSTLIELIQSMLAEPEQNNNYTSVDLVQLTDSSKDFASQNLINKLCCLVDDGSSNKIEDPSKIKSIITGGVITTNVKNKDYFTGSIYAKLIVATNNLARTSIKELDALMDRYKIIPFEAKFDRNQPNNELKDLIVTDEAKSYLLNLCLKEIEDIKLNGLFNSKKSIQKWNEFLEEADPYNYYIENLTEEDISFKWSQLVYDEFIDLYTEKFNHAPKGSMIQPNVLNINTFNTKLESKFPDFSTRQSSHKEENGKNVKKPYVWVHKSVTTIPKGKAIWTRSNNLTSVERKLKISKLINDGGK